MPLKSGSSDTIIGENIATLRREGRPSDQAAAIAYAKAGRSRKKRKRRKANSKRQGK